MFLSKRFVLVLAAGWAASLLGGDLPALAQPPTAWVARYEGPGNSYDEARRVAVDGAGNVYVTGTARTTIYHSTNDYVTVKYDASGNELWVARYNGPGNGDDSVNAIAADAAGNVYVTGRSSDASGRNNDYATVKYDPEGNELWVARYNGPGNGNDEARALALDATGNVYVTGGSTGSGTSTDYATIKYDANGNEIWVARHNGPGSGSDSAITLALDSEGNVYVAGGSTGVGTGSDTTTIKYDAEGNEIWTARYSSPGNRPDGAGFITLDDAGNVYVAGSSFARMGPQGTSLFAYVTLKYDSDGNQLWVQHYSGPFNFDDVVRGLGVDGAGNVYVTGESRGSITGNLVDYATIKYDADGNQIWVQRYNGPGNSADAARALALDRAGNVYVTGASGGSGTGNDYATVKYDPGGNELWVARYTSGPNDTATALVLDGSGNLYVTGHSTGTNFDYATVKYAAVANLRLTVTDSQRTDNGIQLTLRLDNRGDADATQVQFTGAMLAEQEADDLPQNMRSIPTGTAATATLRFTGSFPPGSEALLRVHGSFNGGTFSANQRVAVP
jgi:hypothetical protein